MLAVAHRAGNDLSLLRQAALLGADVIEADVHLHRGRLEVRHEKSMGPLPWYWDKWRLLPGDSAWPSLDELMTALPSDTTVMLDLKGVGEVGPRTRRHLESLSRPLWVCARWWPSSLAFADAPWAKVLLSARGRTELARLRRRVQTRPPYGVSVHLSLLTGAIVREIQQHGTLVLTWPVDDDASLARATEVGVDGVITKDLAIVNRVVALHHDV